MAAWALVWMGTILVVNPRAWVTQIGILLWAGGMMIQAAVGVRWLILIRVKAH